MLTQMLTWSNFSRGQYRFTADLLALEAASPPQLLLPYSPSVMTSQAWRKALEDIPDRAFAHFLLRGITDSFWIGAAVGYPLKPSCRNLKSAYDHPDIVAVYLDREVLLGRLHEVQPASPQASSTSLQVSPFGVIPKKHRPDKWRLIVDLSSPEGKSVNDAISKDLCSVCYTSVDHVVTWAQSLGQGCLMAKLDLKEAYRAVPVHPSDQRLLAVSWKGATYIDRALPFGLRSAPKLFSALTGAMMWILHRKGVRTVLHYLDDFLLLGPPDRQVCRNNLELTLSLCQELGFPVAPEIQTEGLSTSITFLGVELDSVAQQVLAYK